MPKLELRLAAESLRVCEGLERNDKVDPARADGGLEIGTADAEQVKVAEIAEHPAPNGCGHLQLGQVECGQDGEPSPRLDRSRCLASERRGGHVYAVEDDDQLGVRDPT